jgi:hypothetical protein
MLGELLSGDGVGQVEESSGGAGHWLEPTGAVGRAGENVRPPEGTEEVHGAMHVLF